MAEKRYTWRSFLFLGSSIFVTFCMVILDSLSSSVSEKIAPYVVALIVLGLILSYITAFLSFNRTEERKYIPAISLLLTMFNTVMIIFFMWLSSMFV